ncbi:MAG: hypothetical protein KGL62_05890 [Bradyrhizobium sp.]|uniref:hypothetical protein n=1 Tax=Bradyrhizobium sp. TaxID=376 RepID=UPI00239AF292|nr:hypothetical protein [Bradyrhizobium sp.]MDE2601886.1 hypothetical protein [Bradyrhizobium sp.]
MNFSSTALLLTLSIAIAGGLASAREVAAENMDAGCHAHPMRASHSDGRWMYRRIRGSRQKCWFLRADSRSTPREQRSPIVAKDEAGTGFMQSQAPSCLAFPNGQSPRNTRWRYRLKETGQRCWYLASSFSRRPPAIRTRTSPSNKSDQLKSDEDKSKKNDLKQLRSVANTNDSLLVSKDPAPRNTSNAGRTDQSEDNPKQTFPSTFDARWLASTETSQSAASSKMAPAVPRGDIQPPASTENSLTTDPTPVKPETMPRFLLVVIGSVAIAMGLFALVNAAIRFQMSRSYAVGSSGFDQSLPKENSSIADILERLNREDPD